MAAQIPVGARLRLALLVAAGLAFFVLPAAVALAADWWWFSELGYLPVLTYSLWARAGLGVLAFALAAAVGLRREPTGEAEADAAAPWEAVVVAAFAIHPVQRRTAPEIDCLARVIDRRRIRSSNGLSALRYVIVTTLRLGGAEFPIELSLADRDEMGFRLLLGRDALKNRFVVDPAKSFRTGK